MSKKLLAGLMVVFVCLFMASFAFAFDVNTYLYSTETSTNVQNATINSGGVTYTLYTISGKYALLVKGGNVVQSQDEINSVLNAKCFSSGYPSASNLDSIQNLTLVYNSSRNAETAFGPGEPRCLSSTGQNIIDCTDTTSCQGACSSAGITQGSCGRLLAGYGYPMVDSLVNYANARHNMNGNSSTVISLVSELKSVTSADQMNFDIYDKISQLQNATVSMKASGDSMLTNKIFIHYLEGGYYICPTLSLDSPSIASAIAKASELKTAAACFNTISNDAKQIINNTADRMDYRLNVRQKEVYQSDFTKLMGEYNILSENATLISNIFNSSEISGAIANIENFSAAYYAFVSGQNYDAAGQQVENIRGQIDNLKSYVATSTDAYSTVSSSREVATASIEKLNILVGPNDASVYSERNSVITNFNNLEVSLSSKISSSSAAELAIQYDSIVTQADAVINKKKELDAGKVGNIFSDYARGISLATLNIISDPLGIKEEEKRTWMSVIPLIVISILDILILAVIALVFFLIVWRKTKDFLRKQVMKTWAIIFVFIIILVLGLSFALNSLISDSIGPTSYFDFTSHLSGSDSAYIFVEFSSASNPAAITGCASQIGSALSALNKNVTIVNVTDGVCKDSLYSECLTQVGNTPILKLQYGSANTVKFYTFYKIEADSNGDEAYYNKCAFAKLLS